MWDFEHAPRAAQLAERYALEPMTPAACADALAYGEADLGLIPIAAYATIPGLLVVPGCAIASRGAIRSLLLVVRADDSNTSFPEPDDEPDFLAPTPDELNRIRSVALDTSSRTTSLYTQVLFRRYWGQAPRYVPHPPELEGMLRTADAAVLIGDPALHALRDRAARRKRTGERLRYLDLGYLWKQATGTHWVSAFWAVREQGLRGLTAAERSGVIRDLAASRDAGLAHLPELVAEWAPRLSLSPQTVHNYLSRNIHYHLDADALAGVERFFTEAAALGLIAAAPELQWLR